MTSDIRWKTLMKCLLLTRSRVQHADYRDGLSRAFTPSGSERIGCLRRENVRGIAARDPGVGRARRSTADRCPFRLLKPPMLPIVPTAGEAVTISTARQQL